MQNGNNIKHVCYNPPKKKQKHEEQKQTNKQTTKIQFLKNSKEQPQSQENLLRIINQAYGFEAEELSTKQASSILHHRLFAFLTYRNFFSWNPLLYRLLCRINVLIQ